MRSATLGLVNAANARDLGGIVTPAGRRLRRGVLFRADALHRLTDDDLATLDRLGLIHVVDFRHEQEITLTGADRLPAGSACKLVSLPLFDPEHDVFTLIGAALTQIRNGDRADMPAALSNGGSAAAMVELYRWLVTAPMAREAFGTVVRLAASAEALPLLFHCTAGKDRTGWLAAVVLHALGVDRDVIVADYLRTNELNATAIAHILARLDGQLADSSVLVPLLEARPEYLEAAFRAADEAYGGMDGYLRDGLAIDAETVAALHATLLE